MYTTKHLLFLSLSKEKNISYESFKKYISPVLQKITKMLLSFGLGKLSFSLLIVSLPATYLVCDPENDSSSTSVTLQVS